MGYGDELMALGDAWRLHRHDPRRRRVAVGDGVRLSLAYPELGYGMDFLASTDDLARDPDLPWVISHHACRPYHDYAAMARLYRERHPLRSLWPGSRKPQRLVNRLGHYLFNLDYRPTPAPIRFAAAEQALYESWAGRRFVVIEPHIKAQASPAKQWPIDRFAEVARQLRRDIEVFQIGAPDSPTVADLPRLPTRTFREALAVLKAARFYIGGEGGLHHGAAAVSTRAIVLYGGYTPPTVTGYDFHVRLTGNASYACGTQHRECPHCRSAMASITPQEVLQHAQRLLAA